MPRPSLVRSSKRGRREAAVSTAPAAAAPAASAPATAAAAAHPLGHHLGRLPGEIAGNLLLSFLDGPSLAQWRRACRATSQQTAEVEGAWAALVHSEYGWIYPRKPSFLTNSQLYGLLRRATEPFVRVAGAPGDRLEGRRPGRLTVIGESAGQHEESHAGPHCLLDRPVHSCFSTNKQTNIFAQRAIQGALSTARRLSPTSTPSSTSAAHASTQGAGPVPSGSMGSRACWTVDRRPGSCGTGTRAFGRSGDGGTRRRLWRRWSAWGWPREMVWLMTTTTTTAAAVVTRIRRRRRRKGSNGPGGGIGRGGPPCGRPAASWRRRWTKQAVCMRSVRHRPERTRG